MTQHDEIDPSALGPNMWLIDEFYRRYREDPDSVGPAWKDFFEGFSPKLAAEPAGDGPAAAAEPVAPEPVAQPEAPAQAEPRARAEEPAQPEAPAAAGEAPGPSPLRGVAA